MHIALYIPSLNGGGAEAISLRLARYYAGQGHRVDLVVNRRQGAYVRQIPAGIRVIELKRWDKRPAKTLRARFLALWACPSAWRVLALPVLLAWRPLMDLRYLPALARYLARECPEFLISSLTQANLLGLWARRLSSARTCLVVSEHTTLSRRVAYEATKPGRRWRWRYLPSLAARFLPEADAMVAVSRGVARDLAACTGISASHIKTIYNPIVTDQLAALAAEPISHPWFPDEQAPVILAAGHLSAIKDFPTLLRAFARFRTNRRARLAVLGEGEEREKLLALAARLGVERDVEFLGWVDNPYQYMARASVFVLSSAFEGFSLVLVEAMACACPVVSTDCESGPREILGNGRYGALMPVGDVAAMAAAIENALDRPIPGASLISRAGEFSVTASAQRYLELSSQKKPWTRADI